MPTFTQDDVRKLLKAAEGDRLEKAWQLALSGLRRGEACGLVWDDVDFEADELNIAIPGSWSTPRRRRRP